MSDTSIYLIALELAKHIVDSCQDEQEIDEVLHTLNNLISVKKLTLSQKQS